MILLVTMDGLDWASLDAAMRHRRLPTVARLVRHGTLTRLRPDVPGGSCAWWASLATGAPPEAHGVTYPLEEWAGGLRPASRVSWRRPPMWAVLAERGYRTASVAFPFARPGKAWGGLHVDERLLEMSGLGWDDWPLPLAVAPHSIREDLRSARVHVTDVPPAMLAPFEAGGPMDQGQRRALATALARTSTLFGAIEVVTSAAIADFLAVHMDWPARFAAALGLNGAADLPRPFWSLLDGGLAKLSEIAGVGSTLAIASPGTSGGSGFAFVSGAAAGPVASVLDVAPRLLACLGEPMAGAWDWTVARPAPDSGDCRRVEAFGHVLPQPPPDWPAPKLIAEAELLLQSDLDAAAAKAAAALAVAPRSQRGLAVAGLIAFARSDLDALEPIADALATVAPDHLWTAMLRAGCHVLRKDPRAAAPLLRRVEAEGSADDRLRAAGAWLMLGRGSEAERVFERILAEQPDCVPALLGLAARKTRRPFDAEQLLRRVLAIDPGHAAARESLADLLDSCGRAAEAEAVRHARLSSATARS